MFKLLKDLTRAPEPLNRFPPSNTSSANALKSQVPSHPYAPRQPTGSPRPGVPTTSVSSETVTGRQPLLNKKEDSAKEDEQVETDPDAVKVVELVKALEAAGEGNGDVMTFVEVRPPSSGNWS